MRDIAAMALGAMIAIAIVHWFRVELPRLIHWWRNV